MNNNWFNIVFLLSITCVLGGSLLLWQTAPFEGHFDLDSFNYDRIAWNKVQHGQLVDPWSPKSPPIQPVGYPFVIAYFYRLEHNSNYIIGFNVLLFLACCSLLLFIGLSLGNPAVGYFAKNLAALNLGLLVYAQFVLAEMLTLYLLLSALLFFVIFLKNKKLWRLLFRSGICFGASIWCKPVALLLCPFLVPLIFITSRSYLHVIFFSISFYMIPVWIMTHNYYHYNIFALAPMNDLNVYQVFLSKVIANIENIPVEQVINEQLQFKGEHALDSSGWNDARNLFYRYLKNYPFVFIKIWLVNVSKTLFGLYTTQLKLLYHPELRGGSCSFFNQYGGLISRVKNYIEGGTNNCWLHLVGWLEFVFNVVRWLLVIVGLWVLYSRKNYITLYLCFSWIFYFAIITGFDGCCRYRIFFEPILILLMAIGLITIITFLKGNKYEKNIVPQCTL